MATKNLQGQNLHKRIIQNSPGRSVEMVDMKNVTAPITILIWFLLPSKCRYELQNTESHLLHNWSQIQWKLFWWNQQFILPIYNRQSTDKMFPLSKHLDIYGNSKSKIFLSFMCSRAYPKYSKPMKVHIK